MRRHRNARWRDQRGQSLLETAMMMATVFLLVFWVTEIGWLMYTFSVLADAANEGVRYAIVHSGGDATGTQNTVRTFAGTSLHNMSALSISVTFPDGGAVPPKRVRVSVSYRFVPWLTFAMSAPPTMSAYAEGRMVVD